MACPKVQIELPFSIFIFAVIFSESITTNWVIFRTCYVTLGYNKSECALLGSMHPDNTTEKLEQLVEPHATVILMAKTLVGALGTPIICFFLGPWSDKYGRKPVLLLTIAGVALQHAILAVICVIPNISPWYILLSMIPLCLTGGFMAILAAILCYINDITTTTQRGLRIAIFYGVLTVGSLLGFLTSPYALRILGYFEMYVIASACLVLTWLIIFLFLEESVQNQQTEDKYRNLFKLALLRETIKTTFKRRDNYNRLTLFFVILYLLTYVITDNGGSIMFLYVRQKFHWSLETYTLLNSINTVTVALGSILGIYLLHKLLKLNESVITMMGFISIISGCIYIGLANEGWQIFAASINCLHGTIGPMSRSLISKLVSPDEYGKIFSFLAVCESFISPLGAPLFTYVYNHTLSTFPGAIFLVSAAIATFGLIFTIIVVVVQKRISPLQNNFQPLNVQATMN